MPAGHRHYLAALGQLGDDSDVTFTDEEAGVITGSPAKRAIVKHKGSVMVDRSAGAPAVGEKILFLGMSVNRSSVPAFLQSKVAQLIALALLGGGVFLLIRHHRKGGRSLLTGRTAAANPSPSPLERHRDRDVASAARFRRDFHWGNPARRVVSRKVAVAPRVMADLGEVAEITYKTDKRGERAKFFTHDFEGRRPRLGVDPKTKRLHLVGGSYTVKAAGITG